MKVSRLIRGDKVIWMVFLALTIISLVAVFSSIGYHAVSTHTTPTTLFFKHLGIVLATYLAIIVMSHINYRYYSRFAELGYWVSLGMLLIMLALHTRWFHIPGLGQFQPSEIAKVMLIIFVARIMAKRKEQADDLGTFIMAMAAIVAVSLVVLPLNFSTAALIFISAFLVLYFGGANKKYWWRVLLAGVVVAVVGMYVAYNRYEKQLYTAQQNHTEQQFLERSSTWGHRIYSWVHPTLDAPTGNRAELYTQENMAKMAVARGGFFGSGVGNTVHARLITQAHNDFIFAIIIEEGGILMGLIVFALYAIFFFRCIRLAGRCKGTFGALTVAGLGTVIYLQALVNMSVASGVIPVTGQTLPFISYGGTAYLFLGLGLGVIQSVAADVERQEKEGVVVSEDVIEGEQQPTDNNTTNTDER